MEEEARKSREKIDGVKKQIEVGWVAASNSRVGAKKAERKRPCLKRTMWPKWNIDRMRFLS